MHNARADEMQGHAADLIVDRLEAVLMIVVDGLRVVVESAGRLHRARADGTQGPGVDLVVGRLEAALRLAVDGVARAAEV